MRRLLPLVAAALTALPVAPAAADPEPDVLACQGNLAGGLTEPGEGEYWTSISCVVFGYDTRLAPVTFTDTFLASVSAVPVAPGAHQTLLQGRFTDGTTTYSLTVYDLAVNGVMPLADVEDKVAAPWFTYYIKQGWFGPSGVHLDEGPIVNFEFVAETVHDVPIR